jgi:uncharacterized delta-60 repeat protein
MSATHRVVIVRVVRLGVVGLITLSLVQAVLAGTALDTSFNGIGYVITNLSDAAEEAHAVIVQPDGNIIAAGYTDSGSGRDFLLLRYASTGSPDISFGTGGVVTTALGPGDDVINTIALQANGNIIVAGTTFSGTRTVFAVARYISTTGDLDTSFGAGGIVTTSLSSGNDVARAVAVQADGKIVVGGDADANFAAVRYNSTGTLDTEFGTNGHVIPTIGQHDLANAVLIQPDGKIVLAGHSDTGSTDDFAVARYTISGTLDTSFSFDGKVTTNFTVGSNDFALAAAQQIDGKIVLAGYAGSGANGEFALARYTISGTLDSAFGNAGLITTTIGPNVDEAHGVVVQPTGKIVAGGFSRQSGNDFAVARYLPDGTLDGSFSAGGIDLSDLQNSADDLGYALALQPDNLIILAGSSDNGTGTGLDVAVARYLSPNQAPTVSGFTKSGLENSTIGFASADFTVHFSDQDSDAMAQIMLTSLPTSGTLMLNTVPVAINQEILTAQLGNLSYTPDQYFFGADAFTWNGFDGIEYAAADATVTLTVAFVNQPPSFTKGADQSTRVGSGAQTVAGWATDISAGPANEASQTLTFTLMTSDDALFNALPALNTLSGDLTYTPATNHWGTATVTVTLKDSGGTANGGGDTATPQIFSITIAPYRLYLPLILR